MKYRGAGCSWDRLASKGRASASLHSFRLLFVHRLPGQLPSTSKVKHAHLRFLTSSPVESQCFHRQDCAQYIALGLLLKYRGAGCSWDRLASKGRASASLFLLARGRNHHTCPPAVFDFLRSNCSASAAKTARSASHLAFY
jgi:hypothetical protein